MSHKASKSKAAISPKSKLKKCRFCQAVTKPKPRFLLQFLQLNKKYLQNDVKAGFSCKYDNFVSGKLRTFPGGINEFNKQYNYERTLKKLYTWDQVLENITCMIRNRCLTDRYQPMHYPFNYCNILGRYYEKKRDVGRVRGKVKGSEEIGKSTEPGDNKMLRNSYSHRRVKTPRMKNERKNVKQKNESFMEIEKLTKNLEKMYKTISNQNVLENFTSEFQPHLSSPTSPHQQQLLENFEKQLQEKISFIRDRPKIRKIKKKCKSLAKDDDLYGLRKSNVSTEKDKLQKYSSKRIATQTMTEKISPMTPISQGFYSPGEYFCTQKYSSIHENEKRYKFFKKGNRGSKSKSKKGDSKSSSKKRCKESYKVVNKLLKVTSQQKLK